MTTISDQPSNLTQLCDYNCVDFSNTSNALHRSWELNSKSRTQKAQDAAKRRLVDRIMMDGIVGEMHLDKQKVKTDSQGALRINIDSGSVVVSGYFFNFHDHKPTFKVDSKDQPRVSLTGGPLNSTYLMDQFHFHVYCTREEAEQNTLDKAQVPGELHLVFFREKYQSYKKALNKFQDGLAVIAIYLKVGEDDSKNHEIEKLSSFADYISRDENRTVSTTASIQQLTTLVSNEHAQYDAYRGNLVEPVQCEHCVDVFVMKQPFIMSVKQMTEFRKAPHCVENDWSF